MVTSTKVEVGRGQELILRGVILLGMVLLSLGATALIYPTVMIWSLCTIIWSNVESAKDSSRRITPFWDIDK